MNDDRRSGWPDRRAAELLLSRSAPAGEHAALGRLLDDAAAPARPEELAGEDAAAAVFAAACAPAAAAKCARRSTLRRFITVKVALVVVTIAVFGSGVAFAARTGNLPGQDRETEPPPAPTPSRSTPVGRGRHAGPSDPVSSPQVRTSVPTGRDAPEAPSPTATTGPGRSAEARTSHPPSRPAAAPPSRPSAASPATPPGHAGRPTAADPPSGRPTGPNENANPQAKQAQNKPKPRKGPPPWSNSPTKD